MRAEFSRTVQLGPPTRLRVARCSSSTTTPLVPSRFRNLNTRFIKIIIFTFVLCGFMRIHIFFSLSHFGSVFFFFLIRTRLLCVRVHSAGKELRKTPSGCVSSVTGTEKKNNKTKSFRKKCNRYKKKKKTNMSHVPPRSRM